MLNNLFLFYSKFVDWLLLFDLTIKLKFSNSFF